MKNAISWFNIAVADFDRALKFYETVLEAKLEVVKGEDDIMGMFPADFQTGGIGGAISLRDNCKPGAGGTTVYLDVTGKLDAVLGRIAAAGGSIRMPRTPIPPHGFIAILGDTEGNSVGLHSQE
ncbi:MAG: Glyoxalase/bleomycin resistance protein/dioxygenase [Verrucomicrobiaceae bacterium]|nr:Glyoxalase/bleomycin resistance protein/dioxygenase [Verrucomicrobiaceae bacterium]